MALTARERITKKEEIVRLDDLHVDEEYQRTLNQSWVEELYRDWDPIAADEPTISRRRNGKLWIVNGQHEVQVMRLKGDEECIAWVFEGLTLAEEAGLRGKKNNGKLDSAQEKFHVKIKSKDPRALAIVKILEDHGTSANRSANKHSGVNCVGTLEVLYDESQELFARTLLAIQKAHGAVKGDVATTTPLKAVFWFLKVHSGEYQWRWFIERMSKNGYDELMRKGRSYKAIHRGSDWLNYYRALVEVYNFGRSEKNRLETRTTYSASIDTRGWGRTNRERGRR